MAEVIVPGASKCSMCGKEYERPLVLTRDSDLCPECRKTYADMAFVYCTKCGKTVTRIRPGMASNGYIVKPGETLHVDECPVCNPWVKVSIPKEFKEYEARRRL